jgi:hypothetical protein
MLNGPEGGLAPQILFDGLKEQRDWPALHMCSLKLWPVCAQWADVSSRGADLKWRADGANWDLVRHA